MIRETPFWMQSKKLRPLSEKLVAYWTWDNTYTDSVNSISELSSSGISFTTGKNNQGIETTTNTGILVYSDSDNFSFTDGVNDLPFTFSFWVYINSMSSTGNWIINKRGDTTNGEYQVVISGSGIGGNARRVFAQLLNPSLSVILSKESVTQIPLTTWTYIACTYNGSKKASGLKIYINGVLDTMTNSSIGTYTGMTNGTSNLGFGNGIWNPISQQRHNGILDEFAIWKNRRLRATEILDLYNAGAGKFYPL
jgi:hypothetical protein